jgi:Bacterial Ig domain
MIAVLSSIGVPLANDDAFSIVQKEVLIFAAPGILENDLDPEGDVLQATLVDPPNHGRLIIYPNGSFTFTPNGTYVGIDKYIYVASDGSNQSNQATVSIDIKDQINPIVNWISPVNNCGIFDVNSGTIQLKIEASDNVGVARVRLYHWEAIASKYVEIGQDLAAYYQIELPVESLSVPWNQVFVRSYDQAGNPSAQQFIWLYRTGNPVFLPLIIR